MIKLADGITIVIREPHKVQENGVYKMLKSKIKEVENPGWDWFYE